MMKAVFVVLAVCLVSAYAATLKDEQKAKLRELKEACITETGADRGVINGIIKGGEIKRDAKLDCFAACMLKKIGVMGADGTIDVDIVRAMAAMTSINPTKANKVIDKCKDLIGKNACETGGNVFGCFIKNKEFPILD